MLEVRNLVRIPRVGRFLLTSLDRSANKRICNIPSGPVINGLLQLASAQCCRSYHSILPNCALGSSSGLGPPRNWSNGRQRRRQLPQLQLRFRRGFTHWLNLRFNAVDRKRIEEVGADRACAEWLLRVGAAVKWKGKEAVLADYNALPVGQFRTLMVEAVDATDSGIMHVGFEHLRGLQHFNKLKLKNCCYIENPAMTSLTIYCKEALEWLEVSDNGNVTDRGLYELAMLPNLKYLKLENLPGVNKPKEVLVKLQQGLPNCVIDYPDAD